MISPYFQRLTKTNFNEKMKEAEKSFTIETEVKNVVDLGDQNRKNWKIFKLLIQVFFLVKFSLKMMGCKII